MNFKVGDAVTIDGDPQVRWLNHIAQDGTWLVGAHPIEIRAANWVREDRLRPATPEDPDPRGPSPLAPLLRKLTDESPLHLEGGQWEEDRLTPVERPKWKAGDRAMLHAEPDPLRDNGKIVVLVGPGHAFEDDWECRMESSGSRCWFQESEFRPIPTPVNNLPIDLHMWEPGVVPEGVRENVRGLAEAILSIPRMSTIDLLKEVIESLDRAYRVPEDRFHFVCRAYRQAQYLIRRLEDEARS